MARVTWSCVFMCALVFAVSVASVVAPGSGLVSPPAFVARPAPIAKPAPLSPYLRGIAAPARRSTTLHLAPRSRPPAVPPALPSGPLVYMPLPAVPIPAVPISETLRATSTLSGAVSFDVQLTQPRPVAFEAIPRPPRPAPLVPMYASFATLQALDYHSTTRAISQGIGREANPLARPIVEHPAGFVALKAGATAGMIWASERMWKRHPVQAVVFMAAANTAMAIVVAHNYSIR